MAEGRISAKYKIIGQLGQGGMGVVYRALHVELEREVAIKFLPEDVARSDPGNAERFRREAMASIELAHPSVVKILDVGEADGRPFYVMELLRAKDLDHVVKARGPMDEALAGSILDQILDALDYCHRHRVIHRDIKPANIMLDESGRAILMDFGLVKMLARTALTDAGKVIGTPRYLAPELLKGKEATAQSDLWSLGVTAWEMLTGRTLFNAPGLRELVEGIFKSPIASIKEERPDVNPGLAEVVDGMVERELDKRWPDAASARMRLRAAMGLSTIAIDSPLPASLARGPSGVGAGGSGPAAAGPATSGAQGARGSSGAVRSLGATLPEGARSAQGGRGAIGRSSTAKIPRAGVPAPPPSPPAPAWRRGAAVIAALAGLLSVALLWHRPAASTHAALGRQSPGLDAVAGPSDAATGGSGGARTSGGSLTAVKISFSDPETIRIEADAAVPMLIRASSGGVYNTLETTPSLHHVFTLPVVPPVDAVPVRLDRLDARETLWTGETPPPPRALARRLATLVAQAKMDDTVTQEAYRPIGNAVSHPGAADHANDPPASAKGAPAGSGPLLALLDRFAAQPGLTETYRLLRPCLPQMLASPHIQVSEREALLGALDRLGAVDQLDELVGRPACFDVRGAMAPAVEWVSGILAEPPAAGFATLLDLPKESLLDLYPRGEMIPTAIMKYKDLVDDQIESGAQNSSKDHLEVEVPATPGEAACVIHLHVYGFHYQNALVFTLPRMRRGLAVRRSRRDYGGLNAADWLTLTLRGAMRPAAGQLQLTVTRTFLEQIRPWVGLRKILFGAPPPAR